MAKGCLVEVYKTDGVIMKRVYLGGARTRVFGRHQEWCHEPIAHPSLSRQHAAFVHTAGGAVVLVDLHSAHGTFLNDLKLNGGQPVVIKGQRLQCSLLVRSHARRH